jgi:hypothetical protein
LYIIEVDKNSFFSIYIRKKIPMVTRTNIGISMPEVIIGLALLTFIIIGAYGLMSSGMSDISNTRDYSTAVLLAQEAVEACRGFPFHRLDAEDPALDADSNPLGGTNGTKSLEWDFNNDGNPPDNYKHLIELGGMEFTRQVEIDQVERDIPSGLPASITPPPLKLKSVKVVISWKNNQGRDLSYEVDTLVSALYQ